MSNFHYSLLTEETPFLALEGEWDRLLERSSANEIFLTWDYVKTWWGVYGADFRLCVLAARDSGGRLRGIAPMGIGPGVKGARRHLRHLTFLGGLSDSLAEYGDFIIDADHETTVAAEFTRLLASDRRLKWDFFHLYLARGGSPGMNVLCQELRRFGIPVLTEQPAWVVTLEDTWERFVAKQSSGFRHTLRAKPRALEKNHSVALHQAGRDLPLEEALDHLIRLNQDRWGDEGTSFHTAKFIEFHRRLTQLFVPQGKAAIFLLEVDGQYVAARYDFIYNHRVLNFQSGWDPAWASRSVGFVLLALTVQHYIEQKTAGQYDFMAGDAEYKAQWADHTVPLLNVQMPHPRSLRARAFSAVRRALGRERPPRAASSNPPATATA